jgi:hypothetical protein
MTSRPPSTHTFSRSNRSTQPQIYSLIVLYCLLILQALQHGHQQENLHKSFGCCNRFMVHSIGWRNDGMYSKSKRTSSRKIYFVITVVIDQVSCSPSHAVPTFFFCFLSPSVHLHHVSRSIGDSYLAVTGLPDPQPGTFLCGGGQ